MKPIVPAASRCPSSSEIQWRQAKELIRTTDSCQGEQLPILRSGGSGPLAIQGQLPVSELYFSTEQVRPFPKGLQEYQEYLWDKFNDLQKNLDVKSIDDVNELAYVRDGSGMLLYDTVSGVKKVSLFNGDDDMFFEFSSANFNPNTGRYCVIGFLKGVAHVVYFDLKK